MLAKARALEEARRLEEEARRKAEEEARRKVPTLINNHHPLSLSNTSHGL